MRVHNMHILGFGAELGRRVLVDALPNGRSRNGSRSMNQESISQAAPGDTGVRLAVRAAERAVAATAHSRGGCPDRVDMHWHGAVWRDRGVYSLASYVLGQLRVSSGPMWVSEFCALSNSLVGGLWVAARMLGDREVGLVTAGDTFQAPKFDPIASDFFPYGDAGAAFLVGDRPGLARVLSVGTYAIPSLERLHRGNAPVFQPADGSIGPEQLTEAKKEFLENYGVSAYHAAAHEGVTAVVDEALADAGVGMAEVDYVLVPFYGGATLEQDCLLPLGIGVDRTLSALAPLLGHLGPCDQWIGLAYLYAYQMVRPGDLVLMVGIGTGMTWSAALLDVEKVPTAMRRLLPTALAELGEVHPRRQSSEAHAS